MVKDNGERMWGERDDESIVLEVNSRRNDVKVASKAVMRRRRLAATVLLLPPGSAGAEAGDQVAVRGTDDLRAGTHVLAKQVAPAK